MCELSICDEITTENVIHLLNLANEASLDRLKQTVLQYITEHATELQFDHDSLKPELLEEMYRDLSIKNVLNEIEDRQVYENLQSLIVSNGIEESLSYTRLKVHHFFKEFEYQDCYIGTLGYYFYHYKFESPEFCPTEKASLKFQIIKPKMDLQNRDFDLMVRRAGCFDLSEQTKSIMRYKMSLYQRLWKKSHETLATCDGVVQLNISANRFQLCDKLSFKTRPKWVVDPMSKKYRMTNFGYDVTENFKIRSQITLLCGISALSPNQELSQLELAQSRNHLLKCLGRLLQDKLDDGEVTLVVRGTEFKVHKPFLAQSPVLEALVARSNRISISDLSIEAFERLVQYLYTGKVQSLDKYAKELSFVACRYKLKILMQMCLLQTKFQPN